MESKTAEAIDKLEEADSRLMDYINGVKPRSPVYWEIQNCQFNILEIINSLVDLQEQENEGEVTDNG